MPVLAFVLLRAFLFSTMYLSTWMTSSPLYFEDKLSSAAHVLSENLEGSLWDQEWKSVFPLVKLLLLDNTISRLWQHLGPSLSDSIQGWSLSSQHWPRTALPLTVSLPDGFCSFPFFVTGSAMQLLISNAGIAGIDHHNMTERKPQPWAKMPLYPWELPPL